MTAADGEAAARRRAQTIALWRWSLIEPAMDAGLTSRQRGRVVRELAAREHPGPFGTPVSVSRKTIDRWITARRAGGFDALVPAPRQRWFEARELSTRPDGRPPRAYGRFEAERVNGIWTADGMTGPSVGGRGCHPAGIIEDHSRFLTGHRFVRRPDAARFSALSGYGTNGLRVGVPARGALSDDRPMSFAVGGSRKEETSSRPSRRGIMTELKTHTLVVPGAVLHYDVRSNGSSSRPVLLLIGSPMGAAGFTTLAGHFADRTVVTYDPRGVERSQRTDDATQYTPDEHADDLHRLISALDAGPVDIFASSGGAVNALALVARHPEQVRTLVAHEPPATQVLPDREAALAACTDIHETYLRSGFGPAMAKFIALVSHEGPIPADFADRPAPDPANFGLPTEDDGSRNDPLLGQNIILCNYYQHDFDALRAASTRIVVAAGAQSSRLMVGRAVVAVAERLGTTPVTFPGGHDGFLGAEYGSTGEPNAFAATLREVLDGTAEKP